MKANVISMKSMTQKCQTCGRPVIGNWYVDWLQDMSEIRVCAGRKFSSDWGSMNLAAFIAILICACGQLGQPGKFSQKFRFVAAMNAELHVPVHVPPQSEKNFLPTLENKLAHSVHYYSVCSYLYSLHVRGHFRSCPFQL